MLVLLATVGPLCGKSEIKASPGFKQPLNLYCVLVGCVSSKKSVVIDLFKSCYKETCEKIKLINQDDSKSSKSNSKTKSSNKSTNECGENNSNI